MHRLVSRTATLLGFSHSTASRVYQEWSTTQSTSSHLHTIVGSIRLNMSQHPCGTLSTPCRVHAPKNLGCSEGKRGWVELNIKKVFFMFCTLRVCADEHTQRNSSVKQYCYLYHSTCSTCVTIILSDHHRKTLRSMWEKQEDTDRTERRESPHAVSRCQVSMDEPLVAQVFHSPCDVCHELHQHLRRQGLMNGDRDDKIQTGGAIQQHKWNTH